MDILAFDRALLLAMNFDGGNFLDTVFWIASGKLTWVPLYLGILYMIARRYGWRQMLVALVFIGLMIAAVDQIANFFKYNMSKFRPTHTEEIAAQVHTVRGYVGGLYGTVSAHAATAFATAAFSIGLIRTRVFTVLILIWALFVSYSRIYLGAHFPLDILFGAIDGVVMAIVALKLFRATVNRLKL